MKIGAPDFGKVVLLVKKPTFDRNAYQREYAKKKKVRRRNSPEACVLRLFVEGK